MFAFEFSDLKTKKESQKDKKKKIEIKKDFFEMKWDKKR